jgi:hypothetical protein
MFNGVHRRIRVGRARHVAAFARDAYMYTVPEAGKGTLI